MNDTLKVAGRIGAELGAAKAEVERLREALRPFAAFEAVCSKQGGCAPKRGTAWAVASAGEEAEITVEHLQEAVAALSQQAEPTDTYTAVDMATAAAQGFRDGQKAEQAPAQDEREAYSAWCDSNTRNRRTDTNGYHAFKAGAAWQRTRPAQTEQQPVTWQFYQDGKWWNGDDRIKDHRKNTEAAGIPVRDLYAAPIAQTAPQGKFRMGDLVKKSTGSEWEGRVVGWYSTEQTKEGYAVESEAHAGSVQIYPAKALEAVDE